MDMNKFVIKRTDGINDDTIGYCISDIESVDCFLDELLGIEFKITSYTRTLDDDKVKDMTIKTFHPEYRILSYIKPKNYINSLSWNSITIEFLKKMKTFIEKDYNGHKLFIGLDITNDSLKKMTDYKVYTTFYSGCLTTNCRMSNDEFSV
jgi:hypothetical protein